MCILGDSPEAHVQSFDVKLSVDPYGLRAKLESEKKAVELEGQALPSDGVDVEMEAASEPETVFEGPLPEENEGGKKGGFFRKKKKD